MLTARFATLSSTNDAAARWARRDPGRWLRVTADMQTAGRGRSSRSWSSPRGGLWMSLVAPLRTPPAERAPLPLIVGIAVRDQLESLCRRHDREDAAIEIKWPNDVLLDGCKIAGILCEQVLTAETAAAGVLPAILGIGINANLRVADLGSELRTPAATLRETLGRRVDLEPFEDELSRAIVEEVERWDREGMSSATVARLNESLAWRGERVELRRTVRADADGLCLTLDGIDRAGRLTGIDDNGRRRAFDAGEIHQLAPCDDDPSSRLALASA